MQLQAWIFSIDLAALNNRGPAMDKRRQYCGSELAALEEQKRRREFDDAHNVVTRVRNASQVSTKEAQKQLQRRKNVIRQWTKNRERVQILDEDVTPYTLLTSVRMASRKYAVNNQEGIIGSQLPIFGSILFSFVPTVRGIPMDSMLTTNDPGTGYTIPDLYNQLMYILLDEMIARRQLKRSNSRFALPPVSALNSRIRFNYRSFDGHALLRLLSLAAQTAALGMELYINIVAQSPTTLSGFAEDWNAADDMTEMLF